MFLFGFFSFRFRLDKLEVCQTVDVHDLPHDALQQSAVPVVDGGEQKLLLNFQKSNTLDVSLEYFTFLLDK